MTDNDRQPNIQTLRATAGRLKESLKGVPRTVLFWTPAPGKWSIAEIIGHMRDMERDAYLDRYQRILAEDEPTLPDIDGDALSLENNYRAQKLSEVMRDWSRLRRENLKVLTKTKGDQWQRAGVHETAGRLTMEDLLRRHAVGNDEAHLGQIEGIKQRYATLAKLEEAPQRLAKLLNAFSVDAVRRAPQAGKWSAVEIACHLRDIDRIYAERVTKAAFSDKPAWWMADNARVSEKLAYRDADVVSVLKEHRRRRGELVSLLRAIPPAAWKRTGLHPKRGELSIEQLAEVIVGHDQNHLGQIEALPRS